MDSGVDAGREPGVDAGMDSGVDAGDAGVEAGMDAAVDAATGEPVALEDYCARASALRFDWLALCYGSDAYQNEGRAPYVAELEERCLHAGAAVSAGRLRYDARRAGACLDSLQGIGCTQFFATDGPCDEVFVGLVPDGEDCWVEESLVFLVGAEACADGYCAQDQVCPGECVAYAARNEGCTERKCAPEDNCRDGVCVARKVAGDSCGDDDFCDGPGLLCVDGSCVRGAGDDDACSEARPCLGTAQCVAGRCSIELRAGDPCFADEHCPSDIECVRLPGEEGRRCAARLTESSACTNDAQCEPGLFCHEDACTVTPAVSEPCLDDTCAEDAWCQYVDFDDSGACRAIGAQGDDCLNYGSPSSLACGAGLHCVTDGTCQPPGGADEPCAVSDTESCQSGLWCSRETSLCTTPAAIDETCHPLWPSACQPGLGCACSLMDADACDSFSPSPTPTDTCRPLLEDGATCYRSSECRSGACPLDEPDEPGLCGEAVTSLECLP